MSDFFENISSDEIAEFRATFEEFVQSDISDGNPERTMVPLTQKNLLDLLLEQGTSNDKQFSEKIIEFIGKISELDALNVPGCPFGSTQLLTQAFQYKKEILDHLDSKIFEEKKKDLWKNRINEFFDRFTLEIVKRWETIENERHKTELDELEQSRRILSQENSYLRGIYSLSLQIASLTNPNKIFDYLARKLSLILQIDFVIILDASEKKMLEYIFHAEDVTIKDIQAGRRKTEDVFELFRREAIDRDKIEVVIQHPSNLKVKRFSKSDPENVIVPMIDEETTWGMIGVFRKEGIPFTPQEVQAVSIITSLVELVARNQRTLNRERALMRSLDDQIVFARKVQERMLPERFNDSEFSIHTRFKPSTHLSGDFYHFFKTDLNERGVIIGDVTGHDIAAAMMMMTIMGILSDVFALEETQFEEMIIRANSRLHSSTSDHFFATAIALWLDTSGHFKYINLGHPVGLHFNGKTNEIHELKPSGFPIGIFDALAINSQNIDFSNGDRILLYTDGLIEAKDENEKLFGFERLKTIFHETIKSDCESALDAIMNAICEFSVRSSLNDDIAVVLIEKK